MYLFHTPDPARNVGAWYKDIFRQLETGEYITVRNLIFKLKSSRLSLHTEGLLDRQSRDVLLYL